jgi:hypothetical protein
LPSDQASLNPRSCGVIHETYDLWVITKSNDPGVAGQEHYDLVGL